MLVWLSFMLSALVCLLSLAPFPGAVFFTPVLALFSLYLSMKRTHWLLIPACLLNVATLWLAPGSLQDQPFFGSFAVFVGALTLIGVVTQIRNRIRRR